jgi:hypothetical protein
MGETRVTKDGEHICLMDTVHSVQFDLMLLDVAGPGTRGGPDVTGSRACVEVSPSFSGQHKRKPTLGRSRHPGSRIAHATQNARSSRTVGPRASNG